MFRPRQRGYGKYSPGIGLSREKRYIFRSFIDQFGYYLRMAAFKNLAAELLQAALKASLSNIETATQRQSWRNSNYSGRIKRQKINATSGYSLLRFPFFLKPLVTLIQGDTLTGEVINWRWRSKMYIFR